jgi:hypothetical protein
MTEMPVGQSTFRAGRAASEQPQPDDTHMRLGFPAAAGPSVLLADVSEFQPNIADATYLNWSKAIVIRAMYGSGHVDRAWFGGARRGNLLSGGARFLGIYQYLVAGQDAVAQARSLCSLLKTLNKGEVVICDLEEGGGNQSGRWAAWKHVVQTELGDTPWDYSGSFFAGSTGIAPVSWVAAYGSSEPSAPHRMWQFTDRYSVPGVGSSDCSVFHGTIDQLANLAHGGSQPVPQPPQQQDWTEQAVMALPTLQQGSKDTAGHVFYVHRMKALVKVIGQVNGRKQAAALPTDGNFDAATTAGVKDIQAFFGFTGPAVDGVVGPNTWRKLIGA